MNRSDRLQRRRPFRDPLPRILVVCEGRRTEKLYFEHLRAADRIPINLEVAAGGTPKTLVERAARLKREATSDARRTRDPNRLFEEVWCVFDVDEHPYLSEAKQQARANEIKVAISNPCFELWILLHFQDQRAYTERHAVQSMCRAHLPDYEKVPPMETLMEHYPEAVERARKLDAWHVTRGTAGENPSTGVYVLVEKLKSYRRQRPSSIAGGRDIADSQG